MNFNQRISEAKDELESKVVKIRNTNTAVQASDIKAYSRACGLRRVIRQQNKVQKSKNFPIHVNGIIYMALRIVAYDCITLAKYLPYL